MIPAEVRFVAGTKDLGTANIIFTIEESPHPAGTTDGTQETMQNLEGRLQTQIDDLDTRVDALEEESGGQSGTGITEEVKQALLQIARKVAYIDEHGQTYYTALEDALYPPAELSSISAVYTPSGKVYESDSLDSLKSRLVVTAHWSNGTTSEVASTNYTLSGTLQRGTSTITVSYGGMTDTFEVDVVGLTGVYAQYTQSGAVYDTDTLDSLKDDLYVYASYSDMTTRDLTASEYTLSGTLAEGTSVVTVSYGGKTATFNVTVTHYSEPGKDWTSGVAYTVDWGEGGFALNTGTGEVTTSTNTNEHVSPFLDCKGASAVIADGMYGDYICFYDENKTFLYRYAKQTTIENPYPFSVPRNAYYFRYYVRNSSPAFSPTPYLYPTLTENTTYELNTHYVLSYAEGTDEQFVASNKALCYGATKLQCSMWARSWVYFYDAEKTQLSSVTRQNGATEIDIPADAYYLVLNPGTGGNANNPWIMFTA